LTTLRFGGPELGSRFVLLLFGVAAMTAARTLTFIYSVPDRSLPPIPPLLWIFHQADMLYLPGMNRLPNLGAVQDLQAVALAAALVFLYLAVRSEVPVWVKRHYRLLGYVALVFALPLQIVNLQGVLPFPVALGSHHYGNDAVTVTACAVDATMRGQNPYRSFNVTDCLHKYGMQGDKTTPLKAGTLKHIYRYPTKQQLDVEYQRALANHQKCPAEFECYYSYPAASFLVPTLPAVFGLHDLSIVYLALYLAIVALVLWHARNAIARRLTLIVVAANAALWPTIESGATDALYALLVMVAWFTRDRRWLSALAFGVAVASRQQAWFFLLFYAILVGRTLGRKELAWRLGIIAGVFLLTNLPYFIASPGQWLSGVLGPIRDPMFARGTGLVALSTASAGSLPLGPHALYNVLEAIGFLASLALYWRTCRKHPNTGLILAPLGLYFAWRSLYSYFLPLTLLALFPAMVEHARPHDRLAEPVPATDTTTSAQAA
jgi:hypothetical protein